MKLEPILLFALIIGMVFAVQPIPNCSNIPIEELSNEQPDTTFTKTEVFDIYSKLERGYLMVQTFGDSMKGTINTNQRCLCIPKEKYYVGDIVLFIQNGKGIAHEIVFETQTGFITKGTNNDFVDGEILSSQIFCKIPEVERFKLW